MRDIKDAHLPAPEGHPQFHVDGICDITPGILVFVHAAPVDHRLLLEKYMERVYRTEGVCFVPAYSDEISEQELAILLEISERVKQRVDAEEEEAFDTTNPRLDMDGR